MTLFDFGRGMGGRGFGPGDGIWFFLPGLLGMLLLAALIGMGVWLVLRNRVTSTADPLRHAAGRYAAGRIGRVEFERIRRDLAAVEAGTTPPIEEAPEPPATT